MKKRQKLLFVLGLGLVIILAGCGKTTIVESAKEPTVIPTTTVLSIPTPTPPEDPLPTPSPAVSIVPTVTPEIDAEYSEETIRAGELKLLPESWSGNMAVKADFSGYYEMLSKLVMLCDASALSEFEAKIDTAEFPDRDMNRDDALMLLLLAAEALGYNKHNAGEYGFYTENEMNYDHAMSQLSWDYPYCDAGREVYMFTELGEQYQIGVLPITSVFWLQRRMDLNQRVHFFDCDENLDFHLNEVLTREAAAASAVRLYNSEMLDYDAYTGMRQMTEEEKNKAKESVEVQTLTSAKDNELKNNLQAAIDDILNSKTEIVHSDTYIPGETYTGTAYYVSENGDDGNDGLSPETAWRTLQHVMVQVGGTGQEPTMKDGDAVFLRRGDTFRLPDSAFIIESDGITFSAYGEGAKPIITASSESGVGAEKWELVYEDTTGKKIWKFYQDMRDVGMVVLNDGEILANRVYEYYGENGYVSCHYDRWSMEGNGNGCILENRLFSLEETLTENLRIVSRPEVVDGSPQKGPLYLRCDEGNPGELFSSVEFTEAELLGIVWLRADHTVFDNISFRCGGNADMKNGKMDAREVEGTVIQNCEFAYGGGSVAMHHLNEKGEPCVGVQSDGVYGLVKNTTLRRNYMHDSQGGSITYETLPSDIGRESVTGYFHILDNVIVNTYGLRLDSLEDALKHLDSLTIRGNQIWNIGHYDNGYVFYADGAIYAMINYNKEFVIADNVLYGTEHGPDCNALLKIFAFDYEAKFDDYTRPLIQNNIFVQYKGRRFADFEWQDEDAWYLEEEDFAEKMYYFFGETESEFYMMDEPTPTPTPTMAPEKSGEELIAELPIADSWKQELLLLNYMGLPMDKLEQTLISGKEMAALLDTFVAYAAPEKLNSWKELYPVLRAYEEPLMRIDALAAYYLAARHVGGTYMEVGGDYSSLDTVKRDALFGESDCPNWELFGEVEQIDLSQYGMSEGVCDHFGVASCYHNLYGVSYVDGENLLTFDAEKSSFHVLSNASYLDAMMIIARAAAIANPQVFVSTPSAREQEILEAASKRYDAIMNSESDWTVGEGGTVYYVSPNGDDTNDGLTPETAWASLGKVNSALAWEMGEDFDTKAYPELQWAAKHPGEWITLQAGDVVLFERGGLWRGLLPTVAGVTYSAYGEGAKPEIWGSPENGSGAEKWTLLEGTDNIWVYYKEMQDCGAIVFNDGKVVAQKCAPHWSMEQEKWLVKKNSDINDKEYVEFEVTSLKNLYFFNDLQGLMPDDFPNWHWGTLYLRCDEGNPGELYDSIEFLTGIDAQYRDVSVAENTVIDNLSFRYYGMGTMLDSDATVRNCATWWIGGSVFEYPVMADGTLEATRAGDGFMAAGPNCVIEGCYAAYCWDNGFGIEGGWPCNNTKVVGNLAEHNRYGIVITNWGAYDTGEEMPMFTDVLVQDNYFMYAGDTWSHYGEITDMGVITCCVNPGGGGLTISDNVIYEQVTENDVLVYYGYHDKEADKVNFQGNVYYKSSQSKALQIQQIVITEDGSERHTVFENFDAGIREKIVEQLGDTTAEVLQKQWVFTAP